MSAFTQPKGKGKQPQRIVSDTSLDEGIGAKVDGSDEELEDQDEIQGTTFMVSEPMQDDGEDDDDGDYEPPTDGRDADLDEDEEWTPEPSPSPEDIADGLSNLAIPRYFNEPSDQAESSNASGDRMEE